MQRKRVALFTAAYPGVERYLRSWYASIRAQTDQDFDLWIALDELDRKKVAEAIGELPDAQWVEAPAGATPANVRQAGLKIIVNEYPAVILVDADDVLLPSRVASDRESLERSDVVGCAARIMDEEEIDLGPTLQLPADANVPDFLFRYNVFGLSNTAYRTEALREGLPVPESSRLIDWYIVMHALNAGARIAFDRVPRMRYRQYRSNTARVLAPFDPAGVLRATELVQHHYATLLCSARLVRPEFVEHIHAMHDQVAGFYRVMKQDDRLLARYAQSLNALPPVYVWWWSVAHPNLEGLWKI